MILTKKIILDCDPGHDDALALLLAVASSEIELKAVTTSAGNQTPEKTLNNAMRTLQLLGQTQIPVAGGNQTPLVKELETAGNVHGESGLDGADLPTPTFEVQPMTAIELMAKVLRKSDEKVTLVVTGPMTNAALFLRVYPDLAKEKLAQIVLNAGIPLVMAPLNVTHQAQILEDEIKQVGQIDNEVAKAFHGLLEFFGIYHKDPKWGFDGAPLHDPCTIAWLIDETLFETKRMNVDVETTGELTRGETVCDYYELTGKEKNTEVMLGIDRPRFIQLIMDSLRSFG